MDVVVEYHNRPPSCSVCKTFGHSLIKCPNSNFQWVPKATPGPVPASVPEKEKLVSPPIAQPDSSAEKWTEVSGQYSPAIHLQIPLSLSDAPLISNNPFCRARGFRIALS